MLRCSGLFLLLALTGPSTLAGQDTIAASIRGIIGVARISGARWPDFARHVDDVNRLYGARGRPLVWLVGSETTSQLRTAVGALSAAGDHGLDPRDYDVELLARLSDPAVRGSLVPEERARLDVLLSVDLIRFLDDLRSGRLHGAPLRFSVPTNPPFNLGAAVAEALAADSLPRLVYALSPHLAQYQNLRRLLRRYRELALDTSLSRIAETLPARGTSGPPDPADLGRLLLALGDLAADSDTAALRRFQLRHGLEPNGVLDDATLAQLKTPLVRRVRQIELALERLRWLPPIKQQPFVVVNIPAFQLFAFDSVGGTGAPALAMRVIVGKALDKQTPVLYEQMRYVELRPAWNVPRSILIEEILPTLRRDALYLGKHDMELVAARDRVVGSGVSAALLDQLQRGEVRVRQRPGPRNPLGSTKFVFPNAANIYLHGTPQTELFVHTRRDFSHGCIRIENPSELATWLLRDQPRWARDSILAAQRGSGTTRALLTHPLPVVIFYTTAVASPGGQAWFYPDIYGHDRELDEALKGGSAPP